MPGQTANEPFALKFGELETLLCQLLGTTSTTVVSRFRKLRPKFAEDGLLTETGNRVKYDLTRVTAICAVYQLNMLGMPQGHCVDLVIANWPEVARALLKAWETRDDGVLDPEGSGETVGPPSMVRLYADAVQGTPETVTWASASPEAVAGLPHLGLDCRPIVDAVVAVAKRPEGREAALAGAFEEMWRTFGLEDLGRRDPARLPLRLDSGFFRTGPYFDRARALLAVTPEKPLRRERRRRLQTLLDYLETPAPIDSWKRFIGTEENKPRLVHMLAAWGIELGLTSKLIGDVEVLRIASLKHDEALELIAKGERHLETLIDEAGG